ncbi:MAG: hypothetical protein CL878_00475 [Dehalococcoidia bacterium]|nr:hypothetical protein [Dehalococcoidia bacterium]
MRLVLGGHGAPGQVGWCLRRAADQLGLSVTWLDERLFFAGNMAHIPGRALTWGLAHSVLPYVAYNLALLQRARSAQPDVILLVKGARVWPSTLRALRKSSSAVLALYCTDDPYNLQASPPSVRAGLRFYDLIATSKRPSMHQVERVSGTKVRYVPLGYDPALYYPTQPTPAQRARWGSDLVFVGAFDRDRHVALEQVSRAAVESGWRLRIWGARWHHLPSASPVAPFVTRRILPPRLVRLALACSSVALGFVRHANRDTHAMRTFEIPATRTFMLAERTAEHRTLFGEDQGAALFDTPEELVTRIRHFLPDEESRQQIAAEGHRRVVQGQHTYHHRLVEILTA